MPRRRRPSSAIRSAALQRYFSTFPPGLPGAGLLLMRLAIGAVALRPAVGAVSDNGTIVSAAALAGVAMVAGVMTPLTGVALAVVTVAGAAGLVDTPWAMGEALLLAATALAVTLLGPGAYSLDARLFGRREVVISHPPRR